jgi:hypothetical protein
MLLQLGRAAFAASLLLPHAPACALGLQRMWMTAGSVGGTASAPSGAADSKQTNLVEATEAITGQKAVDATQELLGRLKDKGLVRTAGYIDGEWTSGSVKGSTFQVTIGRVHECKAC